MSRDITKLQTSARMLAEEFERRCAKEGLIIKITDCVRTKEEQNAVGASRTNCKYPYSYHNWGLAFDICQNDKKCPYPTDNEWWEKVIVIGEGLGLEAGGHRKGFVDKPHFQLNSFTDGNNECEILVRAFKEPKNFFKSDIFKYKTPAKSITPESITRKVLWLQTRLTIHGIPTEIDGAYGPETINNVKEFWLRKTGKTCTGKLVKPVCIKMLAAIPE